MGSCVSIYQEGVGALRNAADRDQKVSLSIERQLNTQAQEDKKLIKLLLLGTWNSGKSTVMKQFKIIHKRGFTTEERKVFRDALWKSAILAFRILCQQRQEFLSNIDPAGWEEEIARLSKESEDKFIEPSQIDAYCQFLLYRLPDDIPFYEEVSIPVAASDQNPRSTELAFSPYRRTKRANSTIGVTSKSNGSTESGLALPATAVKPSLDIEDGPMQMPLSPPDQLDEFLLMDQPPSVNGDEPTNLSNTFSDPNDDLEAEQSLLDEPMIEEDEDEEHHLPLLENGMDAHLMPPPDSVSVLTDEVKLRHKSNLKKPKSKSTKSRKPRSFVSPEEEVEYKKRKKEQKVLKRKQMEFLKADGSNSQPSTENFPTSLGQDSQVDMDSRSNRRTIMSGSSRGSLRQNKEPQVIWEKQTVGQLLQKIWTDPIIQHVYQKEEKSPHLEAPLGYIMNGIDRMVEIGYHPTNEDILNARKRTNGVNLLHFEATTGAKFLLIDVGGQKSERKKWLAHFDIVDAIIFVVGLDQYDQVMMEDGVEGNRLIDSITLFEEICTSPWFRDSSFLLFLNKSDVFRNKIRQVPITVCFENYKGDPHDFDQTSKFISKCFQEVHTKSHNSDRNKQPGSALPYVYPYITCATDTENMQFIIDACQDILLRTEMAVSGFTL